MDTVTCATCGRIVNDEDAADWVTWTVRVERAGREPVTRPIHRCPACSAAAVTKLLQAQETGTAVPADEVFGPPGGPRT